MLYCIDVNLERKTMIKELIKKIVPDIYIETQVKKKLQLEREKTLLKDKISYEEMIEILTANMQIHPGDTVFVHSSVNNLNLDFSPMKLINILKDLIGEQGNILMPTYPKLTSYRFLKSNQIFDIKKTPTYTGFLNELLRRSKGAKRSLHPTKSVTALGKDSEWLTADHDKSIYPYSKSSPYYKAIEKGTKIIGIGVKTTYLSCVHCIDDYFAEEFQHKVYYPKPFDSTCIDYNGQKLNVQTLAHNMSKMDFDLPLYFARLVPDEICRDFTFKDQPFFVADGQKLFDKMIELAKSGKAIYSKAYRK